MANQRQRRGGKGLVRDLNAPPNRNRMPDPKNRLVEFGRKWLASGSLSGAVLLPFGFVAGFMMTALPFLLKEMGHGVDQIATVSAAVFSPGAWSFLLSPIMDCSWSRGRWAVLTCIVSVASLVAGVFCLSLGNLWIPTGLLMLAQLSSIMFANAMGGWQADYLPDEARGRAAGWVNVSYLGGGAIGAMICMSLAQRMPLRPAITVFALLCLAPLALLRFLPASAPSNFRPSQILRDFWREVWRTVQRRECLVCFAVLLAPTSAAINLFSSLGPDYRVPSGQVILVMGGGWAVASSLGALLGGILADRFNRVRLYLGTSIAAGACALLMGLLPKTPLAFTAGILFYAVAAGFIYASVYAFCLDVVARTNSLGSTMLGLLMATANMTTVYMTWLDGAAYRWRGATGLLLNDGGLSVAAGILLLLLLARFPLRTTPPQ
jgi:MFS family permease